jgi:elongation factor 2
MPEIIIEPAKGTCAFGAGLMGWAFTIPHFARLYAAKIQGSTVEYWNELLWGNHFYNSKKNVWTNKSRNEDNSENERGFALYIMDPIIKLFDHVYKDKKDKYLKLLEKWNIKLTPEDEGLSGSKLLINIMKRFLPAADALLEMFILHLPNP